MNPTLKKILVYPTWIILILTENWLPKDHPWRRKDYSLDDWAHGSTDLNVSFGFGFWIIFFATVFAISYLLF